MNQARIIKTDSEHRRMLECVVALMENNPPPGTPEADEMDLLALLIEHYERASFPIDPPDPIEAIKFRLEQQGLSRKDLAQYIGSESKVSEILNGRRSLSLNMIRKLSTGLGISADVLIQEPVQRVANGSDLDWQAYPLAEMRKRGYFEGYTGSLQELREYAAEYLSTFFRSIPDGLCAQPALLRSSAHLRSNDMTLDVYALHAWQVRVLRSAGSQPLSTVFDPDTATPEFMQRLRDQSWSTQGPLLAREYLNRHGIHLVVEPHLPKTYLDGAACIGPAGNPVIALTLRHDRLDNFWFTLMHELAHLVLHLRQDSGWFIDDLDAEDQDRVEREADELAGETLIPNSLWDASKPRDTASVRSFAQTLGIAPEIIAGRLRREQRDHKLFGKSFRTKVRHLFEPSLTTPSA